MSNFYVCDVCGELTNSMVTRSSHTLRNIMGQAVIEVTLEALNGRHTCMKCFNLAGRYNSGSNMIGRDEPGHCSPLFAAAMFEKFLRWPMMKREEKEISIIATSKL